MKVLLTAIRWIIPVLFLCFGKECWGLNNVRLQIPFAVHRGLPTVFQCLFDMEGETLYSVKWYKGSREFYRFTPTDRPPHKIFPIPGIHIDTLKSNASHLYLGPVETNVDGHYSCEVSADAPSFQTAIVNGLTNVVDIPKFTPTISGIKPKYRIGDTLRGNCTSRDSKPAANLTWFINSEPVDPKYVKPLRKYRASNSDLETSILGIRFIIGRHHFLNGRLKIRCVASIYTVYWKSIEKSVDEERPKLSNFNAVTPNTLGVNQLPSPYDFYPPVDHYFDEDFPVEQRHSHHYIYNSPTHVKPEPTSKEELFSSSSRNPRCVYVILIFLKIIAQFLV